MRPHAEKKRKEKRRRRHTTHRTQKPYSRPTRHRALGRTALPRGPAPDILRVDVPCRSLFRLGSSFPSHHHSGIPVMHNAPSGQEQQLIRGPVITSHRHPGSPNIEEKKKKKRRRGNTKCFLSSSHLTVATGWKAKPILVTRHAVAPASLAQTPPLRGVPSSGHSHMDGRPSAGLVPSATGACGLCLPPPRSMQEKKKGPTR